MSDSWTSRCRAYLTIFGPTEPITLTSVQQRVRAADDANCDVVMCFVESDGYALWPSNVVERSATAEVDPVETLVDECHASRKRFVAEWMGCHCQSLHMRQHPSWMQRDAAGNPAAAMCLNSPYADLLLEEVAEVLRYDVDGIYFDGLYARVGGCYCDYCQAQFRATFGHPIPILESTAPPVDAAQRHHWLEFSVMPPAAIPELDQFRFATVANFCRRVRAVINRLRPDAQFILDTLGVTTAYYANGHDLSRMAESVDVFLVESYWDNLREPVWHVGMEFALVRSEARTPTWWPRWLARHPDGDQVSVPVATAQIWAGQALVHDASPAPVEQNLFNIDRSLLPVLKRSMDGVARAQRALVGSNRMPYAAVLHSEATKRAYAPAQRPRDYFDAFAGAYSALQEAHVPFDVVSDRALAESGVPEGVRVLVLPNTAVIDDGVADALRSFVAGGGGLVATFRAGMEGPEGPLGDNPLADLFNVRAMGVGYRSGRVGPETFGGREPVNYYRVLRGEIGGPLAERTFTFRGAYERVTPIGDAQVAAELLNYNFRTMDGDRFFSWYPGAPSAPLLVTSRSGRGRVAYFAAPIDAVFFRQGWPETAELLVRVMTWAAGAESRVRVQAPPTVDARVHENGAQTLVVLANRTSHDLYALGRQDSAHSAPGSSTSRAHFARALIPVADICVDLEWSSPTPPVVSTLSGEQVDVTVEDGRARLVLPRLTDFDLVRIGDGDPL